MSLQIQKHSNRWLISLMIAATLLAGGTAFYTLSRFGQQPTEPAVAPPTPEKIAALGRLEPEAEVIQLSAPLALDGDRLAELKVNEGDWVAAGQVVAVMDARNRLSDAVRQAEEDVQVAKAKLAQVQAGAKTGEIAAQQASIRRLEADLAGEQATQAAEIARWQAEVRTAQAEFLRFEQLYQQGAVPASTLDAKQLTLETAQAQLEQAQARQNQAIEAIQAQIQQAKATLDQISEVRPVDVQAAQTEVNQAMVAVERAKTELAQADVRSPINGQILKIHTRPGEKLGDNGIVELAQTDRMVAVAEVYQTDIAKVKLGQTALITSPAFAGELRGTVSQINLQVSRQNVFSNEPGENLDRRVVEVKIRLNPEDSLKVAGLTNLQVRAAIVVEQSVAELPRFTASCSPVWITNSRFRLYGVC
jgi:HlyD family secretion protein